MHSGTSVHVCSNELFYTDRVNIFLYIWDVHVMKRMTDVVNGVTDLVDGVRDEVTDVVDGWMDVVNGMTCCG